MKKGSFQSLIVWQKSHQLVLDIYKMTKRFPKDEAFCMIPQVRRAAISITANIAEGYKKIGKKDKLRFFNVSQGSLAEIYNYVILSKDLKYISNEEYELFVNKIEEIDRLLNSYCVRIANEIRTKKTF